MTRCIAMLLLATLAAAAIAPTVNVPSFAPAIVGAPFALLIDASDDPTSYALTGTLPSGLQFNNGTGLIYGTPATGTAGDYVVGVTASNAGGQGSASMTISVTAAGDATVMNADLLEVSAGSDCSFAMRVVGSDPSVSVDGLPYSLFLSDVVVNGSAPYDPSIYPLFVSADGGITATTMTLAVRPATTDAPVVTIPVQPFATIGSPFACVLTADGATAFSCSNLPAGWTLGSASGVLTCTPAATDATVNLKISASTGSKITSSVLAVPIATAPAGDAIPLSPGVIDATVGSGLGWQETASGPALFGSGVLPDGLLIDSASGILSGIPLYEGDYSVVVTCFDSVTNDEVNTTIAIRVRPQTTDAPVIDPLSPVPLAVGAPCAIAITALTGLPATGFALVANGDYAIDSTGLITGTPTVAGIASLRITASNKHGSAVTTILAMVQAANASGPLPQAPMLLRGTTGSAFSAALRAGTATTSWSANNVPDGLVLANVAGIITGSPLTPGDFNMPLSANGAAGSNPSHAVVRIAGSSLQTPNITDAGPWILTAGQPAHLAFQADAGSAWSVTGLPAGLVAKSGVVSGTPAVAGSTDATVTAKAGSFSSTTTSAFVVQAAIAGAPVFTDPGVVVGEIGTAMTVAIQATGTTLGYTIDPAISGLVFDSANGIWTGTPDTPGTTTVAVTASNAAGTSRTCLVFRIANPAGSDPSTPVSDLGGGGCGAGVAGIVIAALALLGLRRRG